jgi:hypothetical protein
MFKIQNVIKTEFQLFWKGTKLIWYQIIRDLESKLALNENRYVNKVTKLYASNPSCVLFMMRHVIGNGHDKLL